MTFGDGVPRWARRRIERHLARRRDGKVIRWMAFATGNRRFKADGTPAEFGGNVVPFPRRMPAAAPGDDQRFGATGS